MKEIQKWEVSLNHPEKNLKKLTIIKKGGEKIDIFVEIADTPEKRQKGLMFRKELPENRGMLFVFENEEIQQFYMKSTYISLDMIFVNSKGEIVGIIENARPLTLKTRSVAFPSLYVLEVPAFFSRKNNITNGDKIKIPPQE